MTSEEKELARRWVEAWKTAGPELERIRREEIKATDTKRDLRVFAGLATWALEQQPPASSSGLVEQQRLFSKTRK
jgi:hypothetical protein